MTRAGRIGIAVGIATLVLAGRVSAHAGTLGSATDAPPLPGWLLVVTGGGVVGISFLFTTLVTDHDLLRSTVERGRTLSISSSLRHGVSVLGSALGMAALVGVVLIGFLGPRDATANLAVLGVWAGWWAGYTVSVYLVGNSWPVLNPWRALVGSVERVSDRTAGWRARTLPGDGVWPATIGLVALVFLEVVMPIAEQPRLLATIVVGYTVLTVAGAVRYRDWFARADPVTAVFRWYGRLAPFGPDGDGIGARLPGAGLVRGDPPSAWGVTFVVTLLWVTTFDGFVSTPAWAAVARPVLAAGIPRLVVYLVAMLVGLGLFRGAYRLACRGSRRNAGTYVTTTAIERWFVVALVPIAAGYHLAHFLGYAVSFGPPLVAGLGSPLAGASVPVAVLPDWFGALELLFVVVGHLVAIAVAHALAFELFTGRLQPIRSQYPFVLVMVGYTVTSMWIVSQPYVRPP